MAKALTSDEQWKIIELHIPIKPRKKCHTKRKLLPPRDCLDGILFVLMSGICISITYSFDRLGIVRAGLRSG